MQNNLIVVGLLYLNVFLGVNGGGASCSGEVVVVVVVVMVVVVIR